MTRIPLNPILGETLQRELPTGETLYCEQISHHPAITAYSVYDKHEQWEIHGHHEYIAWMSGAQSISAIRKGDCIIKFKDGFKYKLEGPKFWLDGLLAGAKLQVFFDSAFVTDITHGIKAELKYHPTFENSYKGMAKRTFGWQGGSKAG